MFSGKGKTNKKGDEIEDKQRSAFFFFQIDPRSSSQVASVPARMNHQRKKRKEHFDLTPQSFLHALLPLRGKRFLTIKKNKTFLLKTIRPTSNKLYGELKLNNLGYCAFEVFKDDNEEKILESYFFHGPRVEIDIHLTWPEDLFFRSNFESSSSLRGSKLSEAGLKQEEQVETSSFEGFLPSNTRLNTLAIFML